MRNNTTDSEGTADEQVGTDGSEESADPGTATDAGAAEEGSSGDEPELATRLEAVPRVLKEWDQWVCWREESRDGRPTKVPIKPYKTNGTPLASTTDESTWRGFEEAVSFHKSERVRTDGVGFVFGPDRPVVGVDLDDCRDPATGELSPWASDIVDRLDAYAEVSPSGTGVHVLLIGHLPPGANRQHGVEMYDEARYFTVTGEHIPSPRRVTGDQGELERIHAEYVRGDWDGESVANQDAGDDATTELVDEFLTGVDTEGGAPVDDQFGTGGDDEGQAGGEQRPAPASADRWASSSAGASSEAEDEGDELAPGLDAAALGTALRRTPERYLPDPVPATIEELSGPGTDLSDEALLQRARDSQSGEVIGRLVDGDTSLWEGYDSRYPSQSEAEMALCCYLAFWTAGDPVQMDRLIRSSGLMRPKWDRQHYATGSTYGGVTILKAILRVDDHYSPSSETGEEGAGQHGGHDERRETAGAGTPAEGDRRGGEPTEKGRGSSTPVNPGVGDTPHSGGNTPGQAPDGPPSPPSSPSLNASDTSSVDSPALEAQSEDANDFREELSSALREMDATLRRRDARIRELEADLDLVETVLERLGVTLDDTLEAGRRLEADGWPDSSSTDDGGDWRALSRDQPSESRDPPSEPTGGLGERLRRWL